MRQIALLRWIVAFMITLIALSGCGSGVTNANGSLLTSITVTPAYLIMNAGASQQFTAIGTYADDTTQNITNQVTWTSSFPVIATVTTSGLVTAVAKGDTSITAELGNINYTLTVTVNDFHNSFETALTITAPARLRQVGYPLDTDDFYSFTVSRPCQLGIAVESVEANMIFTLYDNSRNIISMVSTSWWPDGHNSEAFMVSAPAGTYYIEAKKLFGVGYYNLVVDTYPWLPTSPVGAPSGVTSVWTGTEMIVLGDTSTTGARYDPATDSWSPISSTNAPLLGTGGRQPTVWTGSEVLTAGHYGNGRYNPVSDVWTSISTTNSPDNYGYRTTGIWTGTEMIVPKVCVGLGASSVAARYTLATDSWAAISAINAPECPDGFAWTGTEMLAWSGQSAAGGRYNPATDTWTPISATNAPGAMYRPFVFWTGKEMIVFGGPSSNIWDKVSYGYKYDPADDKWTPMSMVNAPTGLSLRSAAWVGTEMLVWGSYEDDPLTVLWAGFNYNTSPGGKYNPDTDTWSIMDTRNAPVAREGSNLYWIGDELLIWQGVTGARWAL